MLWKIGVRGKCNDMERLNSPKSKHFADGDLISVEVSAGNAMLACEDDKKTGEG